MSRLIKGIFLCAILVGSLSSNCFGTGLGYNVNDISIGAGGQIDMCDYSGISHSDTYAEISGYIKSGYNKGSWDGDGIISSAAKSNPGYTLGILTGANYKTATRSTFFGVTVVSTDILVMYTLYGDSNFDGVVNTIDYLYVKSAYSLLHDSDSSNDPIINWRNGDYNYDGVINSLDCSLVPEPSSLVLFATFALGLFGFCCKNIARRAKK